MTAIINLGTFSDNFGNSYKCYFNPQTYNAYAVGPVSENDENELISFVIFAQNQNDGKEKCEQVLNNKEKP